MDLLLQRVLQLGASLAAPGAFSERAFLNDKLDLVQAEAIADLIDAESATAARLATRTLQGAGKEWDVIKMQIISATLQEHVIALLNQEYQASLQVVFYLLFVSDPRRFALVSL